MGVEGISEASGAESGEEQKVEREDPVKAHERKSVERDEARRARSERLGHELHTETETKEVKEEKKTTKKSAEPEKSE